ncbi:hypothetical protein AVEN_1440-1 [Araneus ventricosus]|uniref:Uncharacterized protein n=1 Tax=Araneus ventricosus TaxID=182803 RepID=A0A4Y2RM66_ARAVE|nr:hypothetical protein AVEN_1440-1 [Araneus ventricosus]
MNPFLWPMDGRCIAVIRIILGMAPESFSAGGGGEAIQFAGLGYSKEEGHVVSDNDWSSSPVSLRQNEEMCRLSCSLAASFP